MTYTPEYFINEIYDLEAVGMLSDLALRPNLFLDFLSFEELNRKNAIAYIKSVLAECYKCGHLRVAISHQDEELYGYAMMFTLPDPKYPKYLHKIYVKEQYRGHGLGSQILKAFSENEPRISLLCPEDKISFYEKHGFHLVQEYGIPENENFLLSKGLYSGLYLMNNHTETLGAPIFLLNDRDIIKIIGAEKI
ncbi:GNAT family N-acetyltransferase [Plesiomonas shigelloides]|uniref:GNAT family N-acetyltransferase n=1 Tax=Plesiomonas shigelloides TaxID=703 RepID=UPI00126239D7|nr:GNAT family N-acetyltransferase [Plesiomonas shigelloides]KAB7660445.1 GNAT family N-acetyltransferase [Plesiomonas shigelloides]